MSQLKSISSEIGNKNKTYYPTTGCRILEFEVGSNYQRVELWDVSGDLKYEHCWPAVMDGLHCMNETSTCSTNDERNGKRSKVDGVLLVYNLDETSQHTEVGLWYDHFVLKQKLDKDNACMVLVHSWEGEKSFHHTSAPQLQQCKRTIYSGHQSQMKVKESFTEWVDLLSCKSES